VHPVFIGHDAAVGTKRLAGRGHRHGADPDADQLLALAADYDDAGFIRRLWASARGCIVEDGL